MRVFGWTGRGAALAAGCAALALTLSAETQAPRQVDDATLLQPPAGEWVTYGRDYAETHHSPLTQIDQSNVSRLGLAWSVEVGSQGKLETTPLVWDGLLIGTSTWSVVYAIDVRTGTLKWKWDPGLVKGGFSESGPRYCCGPVNRGVAVYKGRAYVGLLDGRLVALNAQTGDVAWSVQTTPPGSDYSITGAPRIVKGKVLIGNGGGEYGVRGYLTAYDADSGKQAWRWYVVPGDPSLGLEDASMERAVKTWRGERVALEPGSSKPGVRRQSLSLLHRRATR
jgi:quinohemoprotein ethanol dehydrogenase